MTSSRRNVCQLLRVIVICSIFQIVATLFGTPLDGGFNQLALENHLLRLKRQQSSSGPPTTNNNQPQQGASLAASSSSLNPDSPSNPQDANNSEDKAPEEALSSLKCDFGTSDSPDLCKFKILDSQNPLYRGLNLWSAGSGKLALYQGGPLIDASERNDTLGGYIFYETSNHYANAANQSALSGYGYQQTSAYGNHFHDRNQPMAGHEHVINNDYSIISSPAFLKPGSRNEQHVSSPRFTVGGGPPGAAFISPNLTAPGPSGMCLSFHYAIQGLSAEELRVHVNDLKTERSRQIWASSESAGNNWTKAEVLYSVNNLHTIMFSTSGSSLSTKDSQQRKFRGYIALDEVDINKHDSSSSDSACKGHCNFDGDLCGWTNAENGPEDDFDWFFGRSSNNLFTGPSRDFVSSVNNEPTGSYLFTDSGYPRRPGDKAVLMSPIFQPTAVNDAMCMRFAVHMFGSGVGSLIIKIRYTEDSGPSLIQPIASGEAPSSASSTAAPMSATRSESSPNNDLIIWEMSGDAGNNWHQAQTSVSSAKSPFQVLIEGVIGENQLGNIAIDEISFSSGPCPTSPPIASKNYGDCTFEQSTCYWRNPEADIHLDDLNWVRSADEQSIHGPNFDHTLKRRSGSYLKLENTFREPKSGTRAFLLSPVFQPKAQGNVQCLSFYYYMFMRSISSSGPNLGTIRVYLASNNELVPIWRLTNPISSPNWKHGRASLSTALVDGQPTAPSKLFQIAFEGIWGDAAGGAIALDDITVFDGACDIMPQEAKSVPGECTFDVDLCSWSNKSSAIMQNMDAENVRSPFLQSVNSASGSKLAITTNKMRTNWQLATVDSRPVNLQDHTYKAPIGYVYVDVLDGSPQQVSFPLQSGEVTVQNGQQLIQCLSFWFAAFGRQENNLLNIYITQASVLPISTAEGAPSSSPSVPARAGASTSANGQANPNSPVAGNQQPAGLNQPSSTLLASSSDSDSEDSNAWRLIDGKLLWSISLRNISEANRRKWLYGQVTLKADSNHIVRFVALSNDGGFALDDISYYDGACETRPIMAKTLEADEAEQPGSNKP